MDEKTQLIPKRREIMRDLPEPLGPNKSTEKGEDFTPELAISLVEIACTSLLSKNTSKPG
jgi:hypothetical protein